MTEKTYTFRSAAEIYQDYMNPRCGEITNGHEFIQALKTEEKDNKSGLTLDLRKAADFALATRIVLRRMNWEQIQKVGESLHTTHDTNKRLPLPQEEPENEIERRGFIERTLAIYTMVTAQDHGMNWTATMHQYNDAIKSDIVIRS